jgi:hypothetical protein
LPRTARWTAQALRAEGGVLGDSCFCIALPMRARVDIGNVLSLSRPKLVTIARKFESSQAVVATRFSAGHCFDARRDLP